MQWYTKNPAALGLIPTFLSEDDPRPASEQFNERYAHGGGWHPTRSKVEVRQGVLHFPEYEEKYQPIGLVVLREEVITVYESAWVSIQTESTLSVARMD